MSQFNLRQQQKMFIRSRASSLLSVVAETDGIFACLGDKTPYLGACFICSTLIGSSDDTAAALYSTLNGDVPDDTFIQVQQLSVAYIESILNEYRAARNKLETWSHLTQEQKELLRASMDRRIEFMRNGTRTPPFGAKSSKLKNNFVLVSVKVKCSRDFPEQEMQSFRYFSDSIREGLRSVGMFAERIGRQDYILIMRSILGGMKDAAADWFDDGKMILDQVFQYDDEIVLKADSFKINDTHFLSASVQSYPDEMVLGVMNYLVGDIMDGTKQITEPFMITTTIYYPPLVKEKSRINNIENSLNYQSLGVWSKFSVQLKNKIHGIKPMTESMAKGARAVRCWTSVLLTNETEDGLRRAYTAVRAYYSGKGFTLINDKWGQGMCFLYQLPLHPQVDVVTQLQRYHSMTTEHAVHLLPILGEWRGTVGKNGPGAAIAVTGRRGQVALFDLYDSTGNYNLLVAAASGSGKSYFANHVVETYLQKGAKIRVIDVGASYEAMCEVFGGQFLRFSESSRISFNPFTSVKDLSDEMEMLKIILSKMASPNAGLSNFELSQIEQCLQEVWMRLNNRMTITDLHAELHKKSEDSGDRRISDLAHQFYPYTRHGSHGKWFDGPCSVEYDNALVVLELEELKSKKDLQSLILLQLMMNIANDFFERSSDKRQTVVQPKILLIDEAWDLLTDPVVLKFLEEAYRRYRKVNASVGIITQNLNDIYQSAVGMAIVSNSANMVVLRQTEEALTALRKSEQFSLGGEYALKMLASLETLPGEYSELMLRQDKNWGVFRFATDPFSNLMTSTLPEDRIARRNLQAKGYTATEAIEQILRDRKAASVQKRA